MAQALAGSQSAFEQIVRRYQRPVISLLIRLTGDAALAEDLAQEAFVKAFRNLAAFDTRRRLSSWLFRIAHNTGIDALRKARPVTVDIDAAAPPDLLIAAPAADPVERRALGQAIDAPWRSFARTSGPRSCCATNRASHLTRSARYSASPRPRRAATSIARART